MNENNFKNISIALVALLIVVIPLLVFFVFRDRVVKITPVESDPVYVTFAGHIEDNLAYTDCDYYERRRTKLLQFVDMLEQYDIPFNLQASYEWFSGVATCDTPQLRATTDGLNIMDYLALKKNVEIDVHQEGASDTPEDVASANNWADIRYLAGTVTDHVTETAGFQWDNPQQYEEFQYGQRGRKYREFTWYPEILTGGVSVDHTNGDFSRDDTSIGIWIPSGFSEDEFFIHDSSADAHMIHIGAGPNQFMNDWGLGSKKDCHFQSSVDFVKVVSDYLDHGRLEPERMYTYSMFIPQKVMFNEEEYPKAEVLMQGFAQLRDEGKVAFATFTELVEVWKETYNAEPNIVTYDRIDRADYTCSLR